MPDPSTEPARHGQGGEYPYPVPAGAALALNGMGGFVWELAADRLDYDDAGLALMGLDAEEYDGDPRSTLPRLLPQEVPAVTEQIQRALRERSALSLYFRVRHRDDGLHWRHVQGHVVRDGTGRAVRIVGVVRDAAAELDALRRNRELEYDRIRQAEMVRDVTGALAEAVTVPDVAEAVTGDRARAAMDVSAAVLCRVEHDRVRMIGSSGIPRELVERLQVVPVGAELPMSEAIRGRRPLFVTDMAEFLRRYPILRAYGRETGARGVACLPLIAQGTVLGVVGLAYVGRQGFTPEERTVLTALSSTIAQSLQRALLHDQARELAAELQTTMLPAHLPQSRGLRMAVRYRPAAPGQEVGGDWYDAVPLPGPGRRLGVIVGDVQGHDVRAAAVMGQLRTALHAYAAEGHAASAVLARASAFLAELDTDRFASCVYAVLDPMAGEAEVVRAGHIEPLVRRPTGDCFWMRAPGGLPLGLFPDTPYPTTRAPLEPGATLLLCSDGLVESRTTGLAEGKERLLQAVREGPARPDRLADHLLRTMLPLTGREDDLALLVVRRTRAARPGRPTLSLRIDPGDPASLQRARHLLGRQAYRWGLGELADTAALLASELATNALRYSGGDALLTAAPVWNGGRALRLEVCDTTSRAPHRRAAGEDATSGRGLLIVEELAGSWGVRPRGPGKCVWCEIPAEPR